MIKQYVITMSPVERKEYEEICNSIKEVVMQTSMGTTDSDYRDELRSKARDFDRVTDIFRE